MPDAHNEGFQLLQLVRDEAHRFAITGHRKARAKSRSRSALEDISGVGAKRRKELLLYFGSLNNMRRASQEEIAKVPGISHKLAEHIFQDRKITRLNSSHVRISYAVFCLKKKNPLAK